MKYIIMLLCITLLTGCSIFQQKVKLRTEVQEVFKPILYCPAPNWETLAKPTPLAIDEITPTTSDGEVAKRYQAAIIQLRAYTDQLTKTLQKYDSSSEAYKELENQFNLEKEKGGFETSTINTETTAIQVQ